MARDAYESDTGERDTPECHHFLTKTPVERTVLVPLGHSQRVLNRRCRAIVRIVYDGGWNLGAIAKIFGVSRMSIQRCVQDPKRDEVENDYDYAGEDYRKNFPPRTVRGASQQAEESMDEKEESSTEEKVDLSASTAIPKRTVKKPRLYSSPPSSPEPEMPAFKVSPPQRAKRSTGKPRPTTPAASLSAFLTYTLALDGIVNLTTTAHLALFHARGFTVPHLHAIAQWNKADVSETLHRLLSNKVDGHVHLDAFEVVMLEVSIARLRTNAERPATSFPNINTAPSLPTFLVNVHGFDLSAHIPLFLAAGFTLDRLRALSSLRLTASLAVLYEALARSLQRGSFLVDSQAQMGMSPLEIIALEFALRAAAPM
ncbi:hypothetical protein C8F01DRAFT_1126618 [Mycena amicta]|nr:hypothetical protein C8F01DRAFT_1126618 [Mycena amicta]